MPAQLIQNKEKLQSTGSRRSLTRPVRLRPGSACYAEAGQPSGIVIIIIPEQWIRGGGEAFDAEQVRSSEPSVPAFRQAGILLKPGEELHGLPAAAVEELRGLPDREDDARAAVIVKPVVLLRQALFLTADSVR